MNALLAFLLGSVLVSSTLLPSCEPPVETAVRVVSASSPAGVYWEKDYGGKVAKVKASRDRKEYVKLSWTKVSGATKYEIYRGTSTDLSKATRIYRCKPTKRSFVDDTAKLGYKYSYWVVTVKGSTRYTALRRQAYGYRRLVLSVYHSGGSRAYVTVKVNGKWVGSLKNGAKFTKVTPDKTLKKVYRKHWKKPYVCYFRATSALKVGKTYSYVVSFGKSHKASKTVKLSVRKS